MALSRSNADMLLLGDLAVRQYHNNRPQQPPGPIWNTLAIKYTVACVDQQISPTLESYNFRFIRDRKENYKQTQ